MLEGKGSLPLSAGKVLGCSYSSYSELLNWQLLRREVASELICNRLVPPYGSDQLEKTLLIGTLTNLKLYLLTNLAYV